MQTGIHIQAWNQAPLSSFLYSVTLHFLDHTRFQSNTVPATFLPVLNRIILYYTMCPDHPATPGLASQWTLEATAVLSASPCDASCIHVSAPEAVTGEPEVLEPRLPVELMSLVFNFANAASPSSIVPCIRANKAYYTMIDPMLYDTIRLNRSTIAGLCHGLLPSAKEIKAMSRVQKKWAAEQVNEVTQASHDRKIASLSKCTTLIIDDIAVLFDYAFEDDLEKFCSRVILPNATKIIFCQEKSQEWPTSPFPKALKNVEDHYKSLLPSTRANQFKAVLPARQKSVCIRVPTSGSFQSLGEATTIRGLIKRLSIRSPVGYGSKRYTFRTMDRINEYVGRFTGDVDVRIHQSVSDRYISLGFLRTTYSYYKSPYSSYSPSSSSLSGIDSSDKAKIITAYRKLVFHHLRPLIYLHKDDNYSTIFNDVVDILYSTNLTKYQSIEHGQRAVRGWMDTLVLMPGIERKEVYMTLMSDFNQVCSALKPDCRTRCPCCQSGGWPLKG